MMLTRGQAAKSLGVSMGTIRKMEGRSLPVMVRADGTHVFALEDIEHARALRAGRRVPIVDGSIAAEIFSLLKTGREPVDIVGIMRVHPDVVESLTAQFGRMNGTLLLSRLALAELAAMLGGPAPVVTVVDLKRAIDDAQTRAAPCAVCRDGAARFCAGCAPTPGMLPQQVQQPPPRRSVPGPGSRKHRAA